jgi:hypothetical protein
MKKTIFIKYFGAFIGLIAISIGVWKIIDSSRHKDIPISDGGVISGKPCGPDCFFGIEPGKSTLQDVNNALSKYGFINYCGKETINDLSRIRCGDTFRIVFTDQFKIVDMINFSPTPSIKVKDIVDKYGPPDFVIFYPEGVPEYPRTGLSLLYLQLNMSIQFPDQEGTTFILEPEAIVESIQYSIADLDLMRRANLLQKWNGYNKYRFMQ